MNADVVPFLVPIVIFLCATAIGIVAMVLRARAKEQLHRERMFMAEKGIEIPPELFGPAKQKEGPSDLRSLRALLMVLGAITVLIGIGVMIGLGVREGMSEGINGIFPIFVGLGFLVAERMITVFIVNPGKA